MGIWKKLIIAVAAAVAAFGIGMGAAFATGNDAVVSGTTNHTVYKFGASVTVNGTVNGDVICGGQTVNIDATVNGDVLCAGQSVTVNGKVNGNIRAAGQTVNIGAKVEHNASVAGQDVTLQSDAEVGGDMGVAAQTVTLDGKVGRDLNGAANTLNLNSDVGRDVDAHAQKLELGGSAYVTGNLTYTSPRTLHKADGATVKGTVTYHKAAPHRGNTGSRLMRFWVVRSLFLDPALLVFAMVLVALAPQLFGRWNKRAMTRSWPWQPLLTGFAAMFLVPVLMVALALTLVGIPLAILTGLAWALALLLSAPIAAFYVGKLILRQERRAPLIMLVGGVVLGLVCLVPILGGIVTILAVWFGTGNLLLNLKNLYKKPVYKV